jgi:hypothetical protein
LLVSAPVIPDNGGYNLAAGEMNPAIFERFIGIVKKLNPSPVVWEPFAGTSYEGSNPRSTSQDMAEKEGIRLISYGLAPRDLRIVKADSALTGPNIKIDGALFHPPYYGSSPMSADMSDLSRTGDFSDYRMVMDIVAWRIAKEMNKDGLVCAVGRDYRRYGERIRLDLMYLEIFGRAGFELNEVWQSPPDIVLILRLRI